MAADVISIKELANSVNHWCYEHGVVPLNGQAGEKITERNIRFYRTRGLLDAPGSDTGELKRGFTPKHVAQLRAVRLLQARSVPLEQIRGQLQGLALDGLQEIERTELRRLNGVTAALATTSSSETWQVVAIGVDYLLASRRGLPISDDQRRLVAAALGVGS